MLVLLCWLVPVAAGSQSQPPPEASAFPAWLVPVLRVLDDGRVVPTTGVVLTEQTVLVPSEFVVGDEALVALDGGPDLAVHGRTATVVRRLPLAGLAVLEVPGLRRPAPRLATGPLREGQGVVLQALAPPDLLTPGEAPVPPAAPPPPCGLHEGAINRAKPLGLLQKLGRCCVQSLPFVEQLLVSTTLVPFVCVTG